MNFVNYNKYINKLYFTEILEMLLTKNFFKILNSTNLRNVCKTVRRKDTIKILCASFYSTSVKFK